MAHDARPPSTFPDDDQALAGRLRGGDEGDAEKAFEALYRKYYTALVSLGASYVRDAEVARELVSDVFATVWVRRQDWQVRVSVATYLYQALRHRAQNYLRDTVTASRHASGMLYETAPPGLGAADLAADVALEQQERARRLWQTVDMLPETRRIVVRLRWRDQLSFEEIAAILGTSSAAVQMQLSRALRQLRTLLTDL